MIYSLKDNILKEKKSNNKSNDFSLKNNSFKALFEYVYLGIISPLE